MCRSRRTEVPHVQVDSVPYAAVTLPILPLKFTNELSLDFDDVLDKTPAQEFEVAVGREVGEYAVRHVFILLKSWTRTSRINRYH